PEVLTAFKAGFRGVLVRPTDESYDQVRRVWNAMIDRRPALIARCSGTADVAHAVRFAREHKLLSSVRGGGHNIAGLAVCDGGLMLDLSLMKGIWVQPKNRTARAQAGSTLGDLDRETQLHGLAAVLGFVSETGIAGLTTGGGFGYLTRQYGWTCDNLVSMEVVTAEGKVVQLSAEENEEHFWCMRGGSGNFGIVTSFEYKLFPVGPQVMAGAVAWRGEDTAEVLSFYRELTASAPRDLTCVAVLRIAPPAPWLPKEVHGKPIIAMFVCHTGSLEDGERAVAPIKSFGKPVADILVRRPYAQMQSLLDATQPKGRRYYWKSEYLPDLEPKALAALVEHAKSFPSPHSGLVLFHIGGALNELPPDHSPVGNRTAAFVANVAGSWEAAADDDANMKWVRAGWEAMRPFSTGGVYVNFLNEDDGADRVEAAYGRKMLDRLGALKRKYDPDNLFSHTKRVL
ncbi:MAG TPA: FAD-binding oxidoreductase, partial [Polyangiaceae bacterium]|nr:FAD-binding oxidoreductase [Polyangiaceae bacterium]